jgi:hypothetical protein
LHLGIFEQPAEYDFFSRLVLLEQINIGREKQSRAMRRRIVPGVNARGVVPDRREMKGVFNITKSMANEFWVLSPM